MTSWGFLLVTRAVLDVAGRTAGVVDREEDGVTVMMLVMTVGTQVVIVKVDKDTGARTPAEEVVEARVVVLLTMALLLVERRVVETLLLEEERRVVVEF